MLTQKCREAYAASGLDGDMGIMMPCTDSVFFEDGGIYVPPRSESEEEILDRIARSKKAGRNLFKEEWVKWHPHPDVVC